MGKINKISIYELADFREKVKAQLEIQPSLEAAAQATTEALFAEFKESIILIRMFATIPYQGLPPANQGSVRSLAATAGISDQIGDDTLVLSLLGSSGREPQWNSRHDSKGHVGIPLASADFIASIPMMSRLLKELGLSLDWIDQGDTECVSRVLGRNAGAFHVPRASEALDEEGRKIIAAQDFVYNYGVQSVFGVGGAYLATPTFITLIAFLSEEIDRRDAESFMPLVTDIKLATQPLIRTGSIFSG